MPVSRGSPARVQFQGDEPAPPTISRDRSADDLRRRNVGSGFAEERSPAAQLISAFEKSTADVCIGAGVAELSTSERADTRQISRLLELRQLSQPKVDKNTLCRSLPCSTQAACPSTEEALPGDCPCQGDAEEEERHLHVLVVAHDYSRTDHPLCSVAAARHVEDLARYCGVQTLLALYNEDGSKAAVLKSIEKLGSVCGPCDDFVFYFRGHGTYVGEALGSHEEQGGEQAFVCTNHFGLVSQEALLTAREFSGAVLAACPPEVRILILADCCHTGGIIDLRRKEWRGRHAVAISGFQDASPEDTGGLKADGFTHALLAATHRLSRLGAKRVSAGMLYNAMFQEDDLIYSKQDVILQTTSGLLTHDAAWPLVPSAGYRYLGRRARATDGSQEETSIEGAADSPAAVCIGLC